MSENEILRIAINLKGDIAEIFNEIQKELGISNRTDVLRFLIKWFHKKEVKKEREI